MVTTVAQVISLISYGNEYIVTGKSVGDFSKHSTFQFCRQVDFKTYKEKFFWGRKDIMVTSPLEWFRFLKQDGCLELKAFFQHTDQKKIKDYKVAGLVGGGGTWYIEAIYKNHSDFWSGHWEVGNQNDPDQKVWLVQYSTALKRQSVKKMQLLLHPTKERFKNILSETEDFARKNDLVYWADQFDEALKCLDSEKPWENFYHQDLIILKNYSLAAQQLIFSAGKAWVFGAMGSWNDQGFESKEKNEEYERLSEALYHMIITSLLTGINYY